MLYKERPILIIDDEELVANLIRRFVEEAGHTALVCRSAWEALRLSRDIKPGLIVSDFNLGGQINGVELCLEIQRRWGRRFPTAIISGCVGNEKAAVGGGFSFFTKPLKKAELLRFIGSAFVLS